jgi:hypothetical protein
MRVRAAVAAILLTAACTKPEVPSAATATATDASKSAVVAAPCDMIEKEGGPCVLWGPSLFALIARPELFDGKRVRVIGFVNFEFEGNGLYPSREDWQQNILRNGLWIDPPVADTLGKRSAPGLPNRQYVIVEATFRAGAGGHMGMWSGALEKVSRLDPSAPSRSTLKSDFSKP